MGAGGRGRLSINGFGGIGGGGGRCTGGTLAFGDGFCFGIGSNDLLRGCGALALLLVASIVDARCH